MPQEYVILLFTEKSDHEADKKLFAELSKTIFSEEFAVTKVLRIGKRIENKHRPLLIVLKHEMDKINHSFFSKVASTRSA